ncbi:hypothetical protein J1N35_034549 [Gossypium stocksii]|uniref:Uncharacterized protein n=1 Tax=Gossypium stocksii TaxID=47602 RepID=A0A9D3ZQ66_9ROSI|nr:hypothetical protein J1N35_034549 [Gossypium stocksii]
MQVLQNQSLFFRFHTLFPVVQLLLLEYFVLLFCLALILDSLGVIVSKDKTLVSDSGCGEFAKKFRTHGLTKDFSPVSFRNVMKTTHKALDHDQLCTPTWVLSIYL